MRKDMRMTVLWTMRRIWRAVKTADFLKRVKDEAKALGYKFPENKTDCDALLARMAG